MNCIRFNPVGIYYHSVILYLFAGGYKCRLTTLPTRIAHDVSITC